MEQWVKRWDHWIAIEPTLPGVWKRQAGGWLVRGRVTDPRTGKLRSITRVVETEKATEALVFLQQELQKLREEPEKTAPRKTRFADYAVLLLERKIATGEIKSAKTREKWGGILEKHLFPTFGDYWLDKISPTVIQQWRARVGVSIHDGDYSPNTCNAWLAILRVILGAAKQEYGIGNATDGVLNFDTSEYATYTEEQPNALDVNEVPEFLRLTKLHYPQHFGMIALGFATGLRPSSMRPLRHKGPESDVLWDKHLLLVRRSHTVGYEVMNTTKTGKNQRIALPKQLQSVLEWHVEFQLPEIVDDHNELLFPSEVGGYRSNHSLDQPFVEVPLMMGLKKKLSPRCMRRTFQDLARAAQVTDLVTRAVSGHADETMQHHYSTVSQSEVRDGLAKVIDLAGFRKLVSGEESGEDAVFESSERLESAVNSRR